MEKENKIKTIEQCAHDWIEYKQCCYCGGYENKDGKAVPALSESPVTAPSTSTDAGSEKDILEFISTIRESFIGSELVYTRGSCYQFYRILKFVFPQAEAWNDSRHVITCIEGKFYDITGKVEPTANHLEMSIHYPESTVKSSRFDIHGIRKEGECPYCQEKITRPSGSEMFTREQMVEDGFLKEMLYHFIRTTGSETDVHKSARVLINHIKETGNAEEGISTPPGSEGKDGKK